ncbi:MAG: DUF3500 domain-containing protein [Mariniblastus sp.]|nr:DUF3500 domain-containing protein [Mariniblastus sp.]
MFRFAFCFTSALLVFLLASNANAQQRSDFVSDASHVIGTYQPTFGHHSPAHQADAAQQFLATLNQDQKSLLMHKLDSPERRLWTNLPAPADAGGLRLGDLNENQVRAACDLMATLFSEQGYRKMCHIMLADDQLLRGGRPRSGFGTENFSLVIFGQPSPNLPWAFQLDGHHVGVNVSVTGDAMTVAPSFIGTQPQSFNLGGKKYRPLTREIDDAYQLAESLTDAQAKQAVQRPKRGFIRVGPGKDGNVPQAVGVPCSTFDSEQKKILTRLMGQWVNDLPAKQARQRMDQLESEIDQMRFAWNGPRKVGSDVSYSIQGPSLIIEYACQDLGGKPLEHLHTIYRDPTNEYGGQLDKK